MAYGHKEGTGEASTRIQILLPAYRLSLSAVEIQILIEQRQILRKISV